MAGKEKESSRDATFRPSARVTTAIPSGSLTFGGKDSEHCTGWTALDKSAYYNPWSWSATLDGVVLGPNSFFNVNPTAVFDTTTEFIYTSSYDDIVKTLNAEYDWTSDRYVVQCAAVKSFPDIIFGLSGKDYPLPATDYARQ
ncbi:putative aspartic proteinase,pepstatin-sensitive, partial [Aphelenchoides avenae]